MKPNEIIRARRQALGLSQTELGLQVSRLLGYQAVDAYRQSIVARWEVDPSNEAARKPTAECVTALAEVLGVDTLALIGGDVERGEVELGRLGEGKYLPVAVRWVRDTGRSLKLTTSAGAFVLSPPNRARS